MPSGRRSTATDRARRGAAAEPTASPTPTRGRLSAPAAGPSAAIAPPDGRTRYANGERRRAEIIDAAMKVFAEQGFNSLSLRQIAEAVTPDHPAHEYVIGLARRFRAQLRADLAAEQAAGRIREDLDLELTATQLVALIEGVQSEWLLDRSVDMPTVVRSFAEDLRAT